MFGPFKPRRPSPEPPKSTDPTAFSHFPRLPAELRLKIYRASWEPRDVILSRRVVCDPDERDETMKMAELHSVAAFYLKHVRVAHAAKATVRSTAAGLLAKLLRSEEFRSELMKAIPTLTTSQSAPPATLFVSRESRCETLRHYRLALDLPGGTSRIYFNFDLDRLCFDRHVDLWRALRWEDATELRYVRMVRGAASSRLVHAARACLESAGVLGGDVDPEAATVETMETMRTSMRRLYPHLEEVVLDHNGTCEKRRECAVCEKGRQWHRLLSGFLTAPVDPPSTTSKASSPTKWVRLRVGNAAVWSADDPLPGKFSGLDATREQILEASTRSVAASLMAFLRWSPEPNAEIPILEYEI